MKAPLTKKDAAIDSAILKLKADLSTTLSGDALLIAVARTFANASILTYKRSISPPTKIKK